MKRLISTLLVMGFAAMLLSGCSNDKELQMYKEIVENLNEEIVMKDMNIEQRSREIEDSLAQLNDKYYQQKLTQLLGEEELIRMAEEDWYYDLEVNGRPVKEGSISSSGREIYVVLKETSVNDGTLPVEIYKKGALSGGRENDNFHDHIVIDTNLTFEKRVSTGNATSVVVFSLYDVPKGSVIAFRFSENLRRRLDLPFEKLEIVVDR